MCIVPIVTWLITLTLYVAHMCIHFPCKSIKYWHICSIWGIFVSSTYLAIKLEACIAFGCVTYICNVVVMILQ